MTYGLVSIIVPVYCAEKYIKDTMDSVQSQTYDDWELILVEDCGGDRCPEIIKSYIDKTKDDRIKLICQPSNMGAAKARNRALHEAGGRYIAYIDADDLWDKDKLKKQLSFMRETDAAFCFTGYEFADEDGKGIGKVVRVPSKMEYKDALKNTTIFTSTVMFDTEKINKKLLEMPVIKSEDTALWWKVLRAGYTAYGLDENLVKYRRAGKSLSSNKLEAVRRIWNLYRHSEHMGIIRSVYYFCFWAVHAVKRRI